MTEQHIVGVPTWLKVVAIRLAGEKEPYIDGMGNVAIGPCYFVKPIVVPNNAYNRCDLDTMPLPEGERRISDKEEEWFRPMKSGDRFLSRGGFADITSQDWPDDARIILAPRKKRVLVVEVECGDRKFANLHDAASFAYLNAPTNNMKYRVEER